MICLFDANFLLILFDPKARVPKDKQTGQPIDRAQERVEYLVQTLTKERTKIILAAPALAEFMLLAADSWPEYLAIIKRKSAFEIAGFDESEAVALVEFSAKIGKARAKQGGIETWAKLK